ncbi:MAG TPA: hypothetical protein PKI46_07680, partial [Bacteroidales bacterium]|nr:hypothetical protein [Bacteroidales bacterium]
YAGGSYQVYSRGDFIVENSSPSTVFSILAASGNTRVYGTLQIDGALTITNPSEVYYKGQTLDTRFINATGDTMNGSLTINGALTVSNPNNITYRGQTLQDQFFELAVNNSVSASNTWSGTNTFTNNVVLNTSTGSTTYKGQELDARYINADGLDIKYNGLTFYDNSNTQEISPLNLGINRLNGHSGLAILKTPSATQLSINPNNSFTTITSGNGLWQHGTSVQGGFVVGDSSGYTNGFQYRRSGSSTDTAQIDNNALVTINKTAHNSRLPYIINQKLDTTSNVIFNSANINSYLSDYEIVTINFPFSYDDYDISYNPSKTVSLLNISLNRSMAGGEGNRTISIGTASNRIYIIIVNTLDFDSNKGSGPMYLRIRIGGFVYTSTDIRTTMPGSSISVPNLICYGSNVISSHYFSKIIT